MLISLPILVKRQHILPFFVLLLLGGCAQPSSAQLSQYSSTPTHSSIITPAPTPTSTFSGPIRLGTSVAFSLGGRLYIQSAAGFTCAYSSGRAITPGTLVLPTVQPVYDQGTLQSLSDYLTTTDQITQDGNIATVLFPPFTENPEDFQLIPVNRPEYGCQEILQVTNVGNASLQIKQVSVQFMADTRANNAHYNLIDLCSLIDAPQCAPGSGAEDRCGASFDLGASEKVHTTLPATWMCSTSNSPPPVGLSLKPGEIAELGLYYASSTADNLSVSLMPTFTLSWQGAGTQTIYPAPQLQATFAFASLSQFSCYALQSQQFIEVSLLEQQNICM